MINDIERVLDQYVRPQLSEHYGDVTVISFKEGILEVALTGQCSNCPSGKFTVEYIIEKEVKEHVQGVNKVVLAESISEDLITLAKKILNKEI